MSVSCRNVLLITLIQLILFYNVLYYCFNVVQEGCYPPMLLSCYNDSDKDMFDVLVMFLQFVVTINVQATRLLSW